MMYSEKVTSYAQIIAYCMRKQDLAIARGNAVDVLIAQEFADHTIAVAREQGISKEDINEEVYNLVRRGDDCDETANEENA